MVAIIYQVPPSSLAFTDHPQIRTTHTSKAAVLKHALPILKSLSFLNLGIPATDSHEKSMHQVQWNEMIYKYITQLEFLQIYLNPFKSPQLL